MVEFIVQDVCMWSQIRSILPNRGEKSVVGQAPLVWLCRKEHEEFWSSPVGQDKGIHYCVVWHKSTSDPASFWPSISCAKCLWKECRKHAVQALKAIGPPELELHPKTIILNSYQGSSMIPWGTSLYWHHVRHALIYLCGKKPNFKKAFLCVSLSAVLFGLKFLN